MSLEIILQVLDQQNVVIDDLDALNADTQATDVGEITENLQYGTQAKYKGFYNFENGNLMIAEICDSEMIGYGDYSNTHGCYNEAEAQVLANHMTSGKVLMTLNIEGNTNEYFIVSRGYVHHIAELKLHHFS
jgi:hypothetical protein